MGDGNFWFPSPALVSKSVEQLTPSSGRLLFALLAYDPATPAISFDLDTVRDPAIRGAITAEPPLDNGKTFHLHSSRLT